MSADTPGSVKPTSGDVLGALTATAILLPQAMAFGVTLFAIAGADAATGAYAGLISTAALCLVSGLIGGAPGVISAPTGPALVLLTSALTALSAAGLSGAQLLVGQQVTIAPQRAGRLHVDIQPQPGVAAGGHARLAALHGPALGEHARQPTGGRFDLLRRLLVGEDQR